MNDADCKDVLTGLQALYGVQKPEWLKLFRASIVDLQTELVIEAYNVCARHQPPNLFPTPDKFAKYVDMARHAINAKENHHPMSKPTTPQRDYRNRERAREDWKLVQRCANEGFTLEVMQACRDRWPQDFTGDPGRP